MIATAVRPGGRTAQRSFDFVLRKTMYLLLTGACREKGSKAQTAKLLKAVQARLGKGAGALTDALVGGGGDNEFARAAPKVCIMCKRQKELIL